MKTVPVYSHHFACLYDEPAPVGYLGRGAHYSVLRTAEWFDVERNQLHKAQVHDFAVIWDEDHDTRVIETAEEIYMAGLLSPVQFIGERKGTLTVIVAARFCSCGTLSFEEYAKQIFELAQNAAHGDCWGAEVGIFDRTVGSSHQTDPKYIVAAEEARVVNYLRHIDSLWSLGTKLFEPAAPSEFEGARFGALVKEIT